MKHISAITTKKAAIAFGVALMMTRATCFMSGDMKAMIENSEKCRIQNDEAACVQANTKIVAKTDQQVIVQGANGDKAKSTAYAKQRAALELPGSVVAGKEECVQENAPAGYTGPDKVFWLCTVTGKKK